MTPVGSNPPRRCLWTRLRSGRASRTRWNASKRPLELRARAGLISGRKLGTQACTGRIERRFFQHARRVRLPQYCHVIRGVKIQLVGGDKTQC
jgi:hypothetical protein